MKKLIFKIFIPFCVLLYSCTPNNNNIEIVKFSKDKYNAKDAAQIGSTIKVELHQYYFNQNQLLDTLVYIEAYDYVRRVLNTLVKTSKVKNKNNFRWSISIIKSDEEFEMYTIPGGHIFITTGLLKYVSSESQLLMMFAHEISYPDNLILMQKIKEKFGGIELGDVLTKYKNHKAFEMGLYLKDLILSEEEVTQADEYAVNLVCPFRYDTESLQEVISSSNSGQLKWLTTRPTTGKRVSNLISKSILCGAEDRQFPERYRLFKNVYLP